MNYSRKKIITAFLFFTLILFKVSAFHVYSHQNDAAVEQCSICDVAIHNQDITLSTPPQIVLPNTVIHTTSNERHFNPIATLPSSKVCYTLYGRPPPTMD